MSPFAAEEIGARIQQARNEVGLTQDQLADLLGVTTRTVQGWEAGAHVPFRRMQQISELLKRPAPWFLHGEEEPEATGPLSDAAALIAEAAERLAGVAERLERVLDELPPAPDEPQKSGGRRRRA